MKVTGIVATRGDHPEGVAQILASWPDDWQKIVWDNGAERVYEWSWDMGVFAPHWQEKVVDTGPHGRFAAIQFAFHPLIYVQDDDVLISDPEAIAKAYVLECARLKGIGHWEGVVCNMPPEFRPHYPDSAMVGFGACFQRDAPERAFLRFVNRFGYGWRDMPLFQRESCRIFTTLTPRVLVDCPKEDLPYASDPGRLWKDPKHIWYREKALEMARAVRDAAV